MTEKDQRGKHTELLNEIFGEEFSTSRTGISILTEKLIALRNGLEQAEKIRVNILNIEATIQNKAEKIEELSTESEEKYQHIDSLYTAVEQECSDTNDTLKELLHSAEVSRNKIKEIVDSHEQSLEKIKGNNATLKTLQEQQQHDINKYKEKYASFMKECEQEHNSFKQQRLEHYNSFMKSFEEEHMKEYDEIKKKIESLLPGATTAGLSSYYKSKKEAEEKEKKSFQKNFLYSIIAMTVMATLPVNILLRELTVSKLHLTEAIQNIPLITSGILLMYIPALWYTYSTSKKINLSKRLIEEYSYKESIANTYEGISQQIASLENKDLKIKLLYNLVSMSAENPGKLIKGYQNANHPLLDALDGSLKYAEQLEKLSRLPGFSGIVKRLENERQNMNKKINAVNDSDENQEEEKVTSNK